MPYTSTDDKLAAQRRWYDRNRAAAQEAARLRQLAYRVRNRTYIDTALNESCVCGSTDPTHLELRRLELWRFARQPVSFSRLRAAVEECHLCA